MGEFFFRDTESDRQDRLRRSEAGVGFHRTGDLSHQHAMPPKTNGRIRLRKPSLKFLSRRHTQTRLPSLSFSVLPILRNIGVLRPSLTDTV